MFREVYTDVDRAVPCADDDSVLTAEQGSAGEPGRVHDSPLEAFNAGHVRNDRLSEGAGSEDDVSRAELDLDTVPNDGHVPALIRSVVHRTCLELRARPDRELLR